MRNDESKVRIKRVDIEKKGCSQLDDWMKERVGNAREKEDQENWRRKEGLF
jgi:hypothetical protein